MKRKNMPPNPILHGLISVQIYAYVSGFMFAKCTPAEAKSIRKIVENHLAECAECRSIEKEESKKHKQKLYNQAESWFGKEYADYHYGTEKNSTNLKHP